MKSRHLSAAFVAACLMTTPVTPAKAWGWQGHQYIGNLAFLLLNPNAKAHVAYLLGPGVDLGHAAVWADCVRSVEGQSPTSLSYNEQDPYQPKVCEDFSDAEQARMVDYASRNWIQCPYKASFRECHKSYHFADVNVTEHQTYNRDYFGTEDYDVVQAIKAAMSVLKCRTGEQCASTAPFNITSKREALLLLAHFVGDLHQPLHVGAVYLDSNSVPHAGDKAATAGGNVLLLSPGNTNNNLHHKWDTILDSIGVTPSADAINSACLIAPLPNPTPEPPETWASETVIAAATAYANLSYVPDATQNGYWDVRLTARPDYTADVRRVQARQIVTAGARLASLINSVWPSKKVANACR